MTTLFDLPFEEPEPDPVEEPAAPPRPAGPYSVSGLTARLRQVLDAGFGLLHVEGEISNCHRGSTGHVFFTLKDERAQIRCVMFRSAVRQLKFSLTNGLHVVIRGRLTVYEQKGEYQIVCDRAEPQGAGALQLAFVQLKQKLTAEGLFDAARKRPLPVLPRKIGIVTSLDGAAIRDIVTVLRGRWRGASLVVRPCRVQGDAAAGDISRALRAIARVPGVDVVIVGRGGGSIEDLWAFNEEVVARAIVSCPVPVVSAVGHETDFTIADFVADVRAPTPSAAAALVAHRHEQLCSAVDRGRQRLAAALHRRLMLARGRVQSLVARPALAGWPARLALHGRRLDDLSHELRHALRARQAASGTALQQWARRLAACDLRVRSAAARARITAAGNRLDAAVSRRRHARMRQLGELAARLDSLSPLAVLGRGYALCWDAQRNVLLRDAGSVATGAHIRVRLARGELDAAVTGSRPERS
jgi:exodeoxyribonuclease VII large subunit